MSTMEWNIVPVFRGVDLARGIEPSLRLECMWVGVEGWIMEQVAETHPDRSSWMDDPVLELECLGWTNDL